MTRRAKNLADELEQAPEVGGDLPGGAPGGSDAPPPPPPPPRATRPHGEIWDGCPVVPLGVNRGTAYYLDPLGQLRDLKKHGLDEIRGLFGDRIYQIARHYPHRTKDGFSPPPKFDLGDAAAAMVAAASERRIFDPQGMLREVGAWTDDDAGLIYHAGDAVLIGGQWQAPGLHDGRVYPARRPVARPAAPDPGAARELLRVLSSWSHSRPTIDPVLTLGSVGAQMIGGALEWRPVTWIVGDAETGKSEFQKLLLRLHGGEAGLLQAANATEAGIRSLLGNSTLPVALDELEPDPDHPDRVRNVVELARRAASGGAVFRGSADQTGHQSQARSSFLFSSILASGLSAQDRSRLVLIELQRLPEVRTPISQDVAHWRRVGASIKGALVAGWGLWPARLDAWRAELARHGQHGRHGANFATALACACATLRPDRLPDAGELAAWGDALAPHAAAALLDVGSIADDMLTHLLTQVLDPWRRGLRYTVGQWVQYVARLPAAPDSLEGSTPESAGKILESYGLRVRGSGASAELCIVNKPLQGLLDLFKGSQWQGGVWAQAARRIEGANPGANLYISGIQTRGVAIPLRSIPGLLALPAQSGEAHAPAPPAQTKINAEDFL